MKLRELAAWGIVLLLTLMLSTGRSKDRTVTIPSKTNDYERTELTPVSTFTIEVPLEEKKEMVPIKTKKVKKVEVNTYREEYKDENQSIVVETESQGIITKQKVSYEIYPQTIEIQEKTRPINLYLGLEAHISSVVDVQPSIYIVSPKILYKAGYSIKNESFIVGIAFNPF